MGQVRPTVARGTPKQREQKSCELIAAINQAMRISLIVLIVRSIVQCRILPQTSVMQCTSGWPIMLIDFSRFQVSRTGSGETFFKTRQLLTHAIRLVFICFHCLMLVTGYFSNLLSPCRWDRNKLQFLWVFVDFRRWSSTQLGTTAVWWVGIGQRSDRDPSQVVPTMICLELGLLFLSVRLLSTP